MRSLEPTEICRVHFRKARLVYVLLMLMIAKMVNGDENLCTYEDHKTFSSYACCKGHFEEYGIYFGGTVWNECAELVNKENVLSISQILFDMYDCIVKKKLENTDLTLSSYMEIMTKSFSMEQKKNIAKVGEGRVVESVEGESSASHLNRIRIEYHKIEREACAGSVGDDAQWGSCKDNMDADFQETYARGACCEGKLVPIPLTFFRSPPDTYIKKCALKAATDGGTVVKYNSYAGDESPKFYTYKTSLTFDESKVQSMCSQMCTFDAYFKWKWPYSPKPFNITQDWLPMILSFLPLSLRGPISQQISEDEVNQEANDLVEQNLESIILEEFDYNTDRHQLTWVLRKCEALNILVRRIEAILTDMCNKGSK